MAKEDGQEELVEHPNLPLQFYCECADENCRQRIGIKLTDYIKAHRKKDTFVVIPGHVTDLIERVVQKKRHYWIVEKFIELPKKITGLNTTSVNNS